MKRQPIVFQWNAEEQAMRPSTRYLHACSKFEDGAEYVLAEVENRSMASHSHDFASVNEAWTQLPERIASSFPTAEHLRKWALIQCGFFEQREIEMDSRLDANRMARYIRVDDHFSRIKVEIVAEGKWMVIVRRAQSQAIGKMSKDEFQKSKQDVLDLLAQMIEVPRGTLAKEAGRSA
jgi:hypothetical protein